MRTTVDAQGNFNSWVPIELIKAKDGKTTKMRIGGIASTSTEDDDGEFLDPKGFDVDYFLKDGYFNWNHQGAKDPSAIIGRPDKAEITEKGLEVEGDLFADSQKAKDVYNLAQVLQGQGLSLGFSIEGKALKRGSDDEKDPAYKKVLKARITGCAITPNPKNKDAVATIIKGHSFNSLSAFENATDEETEKAMSAGNESGQALAKESLDDKLKVTTFKGPDDQTEPKLLTKGEVYVKLFNNNSQLDGQSADRLFSLMQKIETHNMEKDTVLPEKISEETFNKALTIISDLEKGGYKANAMAKADEKEEGAEGDDKVKKGKMKKGEEEEEEEEEEEGDDKDMSKGISAEQLEAATLIVEAAGMVVMTPGDLEKSIESNKLEKTDDDITALVKGLKSDLEKSIRDEFAGQLNAIPALGTLVKGLNDKLGELSVSLTEKIDLIGQNSAGPKSVVKASAIEKSFANETDLEKGTENKALSVTQHRQLILDDLEKGYLSEEGGKATILNKILADDTMIFESSSQISKSIVDHFNKKGIKLVA